MLSPTQRKAVEVLEWLHDPVIRSEGRTTAQAVALIRLALNNPGRRFDIEDHTQLDHFHVDRYLVDAIRRIASASRLVSLNVDESRGFRVNWRGPRIPNWWPPEEMFDENFGGSHGVGTMESKQPEAPKKSLLDHILGVWERDA